MGHTYKCREAELVPIPRYCLRMVEKVGMCHAGEVSISNINILLPCISDICVTEFLSYGNLQNMTIQFMILTICFTAWKFWINVKIFLNTKCKTTINLFSFIKKLLLLQNLDDICT
jgi:hypothetical protein